MRAIDMLRDMNRRALPSLPKSAPIGFIRQRWARHVLRGGSIDRRYYELCVLQQLERALKCKEVWVEGAYAFRNPSQDMPADWHHEAQRATYYQVLPQPVQVASFIDPLHEQLTQALTQLNCALPQNPHVHLSPAAIHV